ncbi:aspartate-semialdehyde dehydrogenase [Fusobacterium sp. PH5-7]|uniref:aspartate-semialdehyde dehydrogenase n=1 Tax=Fusobacterium sp. PH5-7 TaxID=2940528 RepID=UPI00247575D3|nr:aspartate-semialdehyde dehydrogenase [Fusobacterium sp. PH5-7]MDH6458578.1 aspartate-semialdehyde dehydrogenase [Fusobacterium sp. PH5-7]
MRIAIVGATGLVGKTFLKVLEERDFDITELYLFASKRSAGNKVIFKNKEYTVEELTEGSFDRNIDIALFSAGGDISKKFAPIAAEKGVLVVDNSSAWRMERGVPLVVPEVNPETAFKNSGIIANPNCSTIQCMLPLKVLEEKYGLKRVIYSTYQAVSGSGHKGIEDLENGLRGEEPKIYPHPIVNNCLPHIDKFLENGYTKEEIKMIDETRKILGIPDLPVTATCVRVPVMNSHSVSITAELERDFDLEELKEALGNFAGMVLVDDVNSNEYPLASDATGQDKVLVGRVRRDFSTEKGINLWVVADNIRKGAATNAVQIAELFRGM